MVLGFYILYLYHIFKKMVLVMARQLILAIAESTESLEQQLKTSRTASQKERLQMLWWLKTGQITSA
jgi:hypothetical protein